MPKQEKEVKLTKEERNAIKSARMKQAWILVKADKYDSLKEALKFVYESEKE